MSRSAPSGMTSVTSPRHRCQLHIVAADHQGPDVAGHGRRLHPPIGLFDTDVATHGLGLHIFPRGVDGDVAAHRVNVSSERSLRYVDVATHGVDLH